MGISSRDFCAVSICGWLDGHKISSRARDRTVQVTDDNKKTCTIKKFLADPCKQHQTTLEKVILIILSDTTVDADTSLP